jgi:hypothetical protein
LEKNDPERLRHLPGQTTLPKAKKWFRRIASGYSVLDLREAEEWEGTFYSAPDNLQYLSHLPCEIDQSNSAFQHIALMMNDRDIYEEVLGKDVYSDVAEKLPTEHLFSGLKDKPEKRKIVKLVAVPWSYGAELRTISKALKKYRKQNPDKIKYLEDLDDPTITSLCELVIAQLNTDYPLCGEYQKAVKDAVDEAKDLGQHDFVEWDTPFGFIVHQKVHSTRKSVGLVYAGSEYREETGRKTKSGKDILRKIGGDREVRVRLPTTNINWERMRTKAPPNLVHSYDSALVHGTLWAGRFGMVEVDDKRIVSGNPYFGNSHYADTIPDDWTPEETTEEFRFPVVTIHDAFSCPASHCDELIEALQHNIEQIYQNFDPIRRFLNSVRSGTYPLRDRFYEWHSNPDQFS